MRVNDQQVQAKAVELGLIKEGEALPRHMRSRVVAAMASDHAPRPAAAVPVAGQITVQPGGAIEVDGRPFPWVVQADRIEVSIEPDGSGMVRLTIPAANVQILKPAETESEKPR